jgi:AcrR family transcriptional regulator
MAGMKTEAAGPGRSYRGKAAGDRSAERRERFTEAGLELFGNHGFAATTVKSLCHEAGLTERYFYESFENREELFLEVATECVSGLMAALVATEIPAQPDSATPAAARVPAMLTVLFRWFHDDHRRARIQLFEPLVMGPRFMALYREVTAAFAVMVQSSLLAGLEPELRRRGLEADLLSKALVGGAVEIAKEWILDGYRQPIAQMVRTTAFPFQALVEALTRAPAVPRRRGNRRNPS